MFRKAYMRMGLLALVLTPHGALAVEPTGPSAPVRLEIVNATGAARLACQLVLAHFVTQDIAPIPAGEETAITLRRDLDEGTLTYQQGEGRRMAVENILCGIADNWRATRNDLNLAELRAGYQAKLRFICDAQTSLSCTARGAAE